MLMVGVASGIPNAQMECGGIIGRTSETVEHPDLQKEHLMSPLEALRPPPGAYVVDTLAPFKGKGETLW